MPEEADRLHAALAALDDTDTARAARAAADALIARLADAETALAVHSGLTAAEDRYSDPIIRALRRIGHR